MDFRFMSLSTALLRGTTEWNGGLHSIYDHMTYDFNLSRYLQCVAFLDNQDTTAS